MPNENEKVIKRSGNVWKDYTGNVSESFKIIEPKRKIFTEEEIESWRLPYRIQVKPKQII